MVTSTWCDGQCNVVRFPCPCIETSTHTPPLLTTYKPLKLFLILKNITEMRTPTWSVADNIFYFYFQYAVIL